MRHRFGILSVFLVTFLFNMFLFPGNRLKVTDIRYSFFLLRKDSPGGSIKSTGFIYTKNGKVAGKYSLISQSEDCFLCKASRDLSGICENCFVNSGSSGILKVSSYEKKRKDSFNKDKNSGKSPLEINGIKFEKISGNIFLSVKPELLKIIPELTFEGIKKYLEKIDMQTEEGFRCNLWSLEDFNRYKKKGHTGDVYLGLVDGRLNMIYWRSGRYDFQLISEDTLPAACNEIFVLFILKGGR